MKLATRAAEGGGAVAVAQAVNTWPASRSDNIESLFMPETPKVP
jgi:hypothetical protein